MAEGTRRLSRGVHSVSHKIWNRPFHDPPNKHGESVVHLSSLSAAFMLSHIQNGVAENAPEKLQDVTHGVSQDSYTRVNPHKSVKLKDVVAETRDYIGLSQKFPIKKLQVKLKNRKLTRYVSLQRTSGCPRCFLSQQSPYSQDPVSVVFIRAYSGNGSRSEPLYKTKTGYYEVLEVSPTATHTQIKTAYYKQSFIYHPDRNAGSEEATVRFSEISEAYTVLGNKGLRKRYDRGLLSQSDLTGTGGPSGKDTAPGSSAKQQTGSRRTVVGTAGGDRVFDFDQFFKSHYSEQLQRDRDIRVRKEEMVRKKQESISQKKLDTALEMGVGLMLALVTLILVSLKR